MAPTIERQSPETTALATYKGFVQTLEDAEAVLSEAGYVTQHEAGSDKTVLFLLGQQPVVLTLGTNFVRLTTPLLELGDKENHTGHVKEDLLGDLFATLLTGQIAVAPFAYAVLPGEGDTANAGTLMLVATLVLTALDPEELIETIHRLPGALVTAQEILEQYAV